ncbi:hypothetical protein Dimus_025500 [Dionaea muscipula]
MEGKGIMPVVIGGMVLDIHTTPSVPAIPRSTTPGKVDYMLGGVARNIAECMSKLGSKPYMISALGLDIAGDLLFEQWKSAGLPIQGIRRGLDIKTATVCNMFDMDGELAAGVASVESIRAEHEHEDIIFLLIWTSVFYVRLLNEFFVLSLDLVSGEVSNSRLDSAIYVHYTCCSCADG